MSAHAVTVVYGDTGLAWVVPQGTFVPRKAPPLNVQTISATQLA